LMAIISKAETTLKLNASSPEELCSINGVDLRGLHSKFENCKANRRPHDHV
jgi:hypothetical protein